MITKMKIHLKDYGALTVLEEYLKSVNCWLMLIQKLNNHL